MRVTQINVKEEKAKRIVVELIALSQWFEVTPLPLGVYEIRVKEENKSLLNKLRKK